MIPQRSRHRLHKIFTCPPCSISASTSPVLHRTVPTRRQSFATTPSHRSNIGRQPISVPSSVTVSVIPPIVSTEKRGVGRKEPMPTVEIKGPLGNLRMSIPDYVKIDQDTAVGKATVRVLDSSVKQQKAMWGTTRAYLANHVIGVSEGHSTLLRLVGVGYRATIENAATTVSPEYPGQQFVSLKVGYSHPIELGVPLGVKASTPQPTRILLEGPEKEVVKQFAAKIRKWRVPEPYKGKGIFVDQETITLKAKKIK